MRTIAAIIFFSGPDNTLRHRRQALEMNLCRPFGQYLIDLKPPFWYNILNIASGGAPWHLPLA